jgi:uncharacterized membrane protein
MLGAIFGIVLIVLGFILFFFPPKKRNVIYGYRTYRSMKSEEAFHFANKLFSEYFIGVSFGTLILSVIGNLYFSETFLILFIENELKNNFDDQGKALNK